MTAREFAAQCGVELVGRLQRRYISREEWSWKMSKKQTVKVPYYIDDIGNEIYGNDKNGFCLITPEGNVY